MLRPLLLAAVLGANALAQTAAVEGNVHDAAKRPVAGAAITLRSAPGQHLVTTQTTSEGRFHFAGLSAGPYTISAAKSGYREASASIVLKSQETARLDLALTPDKTPDFFDEPTFTVAGVTDPGHGGGHGSDTILRSTESLAKATTDLSAKGHDVGTPDDLRIRAEVEERAGHPLEAAHAFERAAEVAPTESNLFAWGADLLKHRAPGPATEVFIKGNRLFPKSVRMLLGLGAGYYALGSFDEAARSFFRAADINPTDPDPYLFLGKVEDMNTTEQQGITERLERFARLQPESALANYYFAQSLWRQKKDASTAAIVQPLLKKADPARSQACCGIAAVRNGSRCRE